MGENAATPTANRISPFSVRLLVRMIRAYQRVSRYTPPTCRFMPSCSEYTAQAFVLHGPWRGGWLALRRIVRCHPFCPGGYDPVPGAVSTPVGTPEPTLLATKEPDLPDTARAAPAFGKES